LVAVVADDAARLVEHLVELALLVMLAAVLALRGVIEVALLSLPLGVQMVLTLLSDPLRPAQRKTSIARAM
jgi:hypothetical protein